MRMAHRSRAFSGINSSGGPSWIDSERFDVLAKAEGDLPRGPDSPLPSMIRALLAERFNLVVHTEKRDLPIYALVIARTDRRTGPQIKPSAFDCSAGRGRGAPPPPPPAPVPGERPQCGIRFLVGNISAGASPWRNLRMRCRGCRP